ncbi:unnamed protein product [Calypogeia fissa]
MMTKGHHMHHSRADLWTVVIVGMATMMICGGGQLASAHQFSIQNQLNDSVLVECHSALRSNGEQQLMAGKRYVFSWFEKAAKAEDWVCGFSWLGTTYVKQFSVWNHTLVWGAMLCDNCEWKVDPSGFFLRAGLPNRVAGYMFMFDWDTNCLSSSSSNLTNYFT